jgi:hypothetical protein
MDLVRRGSHHLNKPEHEDRLTCGENFWKFRYWLGSLLSAAACGSFIALVVSVDSLLWVGIGTGGIVITGMSFFVALAYLALSLSRLIKEDQALNPMLKATDNYQKLFSLTALEERSRRRAPHAYERCEFTTPHYASHVIVHPQGIEVQLLCFYPSSGFFDNTSETFGLPWKKRKVIQSSLIKELDSEAVLEIQQQYDDEAERLETAARQASAASVSNQESFKQLVAVIRH